MITINLKEIFSVDNQTDIASKLNFNFNQLLTLGVGQPGPAGATGAAGPAGPIGPIGETGTAGSQVFSTSSSTFFSLPSDPEDAITGDYYIANNAIYKKTAAYGTNGGQWMEVSNFETIFTGISQAGTSTWQIGSYAPDALSRNLSPIKAYAGYDRNISAGTSGNWSTNDPDWRGSSSHTNSQVTLFNFDPSTVKNYVTTSGENGYLVNIATARLGSSGSSSLIDAAFPYTALMSLYSFYENATSDIEGDQFEEVDGTSSGYRHQIELGSVDDLTEPIVSTSADSKFVMSPTWQNLRIRKYRSTSSLAGGAIINADFNINSADGNYSPALNSRFTWRINKKPNATQGSGTNLTLSLASSQIESTALGLTGINIDGLHLKGGTSGAYKLAIGLDPNNSGAVKNAIISSDSAGSIDTMVFNNLNLRVTSTSGGINSTSSLTSTGFTSNRSFTISSTGSLADVTISSGASGRSVFVIAPNANQHIYIGRNSSNTSGNWTTSSGYALKINGNRLAAGIPFPVSTSATPTVSSSDGNVLDEYMELSFTPTISWDGTLPVPGTNVLTTGTGNGPTIDSEEGRFVKIGKLVNFNIRFRITAWQARIPSTSSSYPASVGLATRDIKVLNYGNLSTSATNPFRNLTFGAEPNYLTIRDLPDHWPAPAAYSSFGGGNFNVEISTNAGEPVLRGNPFVYSWGGTATGGTAGTSSTTSGTSSRMWASLEPASIHGKLTTYTVGSVEKPQIQLYGYRQFPTITGLTDSGYAGMVSPVKCRVSVYDFLRPVSSTRSIFVTITGSYITDHTNANNDGTSFGGQEPAPDPGDDPIV
jgi:hypothetical protein